jgi:hypothetical protein
MAEVGNKYALGNDGGRPPIFETVEQLDNVIQAYFDKIEADKGIVTIAGLTYALGFASRQSLYDYKDKPEFSYSIKRALLMVEVGYEQKLSGAACTGSIFALKNMGWKDKSETEHSGKMQIEQITGMEVK